VASQPLEVVGRALDLEGFVAVETMPRVSLPLSTFSIANGTTWPSSRQTIECRAAPRWSCPIPSAWTLARELRHHGRHHVGHDRIGRTPRRFDPGDIEIALLVILDDFGVPDRPEPRRLDEPGNRRSGALTRGPLRSSAVSGDFAGTPSSTSASRRGVTKAWAGPVASPCALRPSTTSRCSLRPHATACARGSPRTKLEQQISHANAPTAIAEPREPACGSPGAGRPGARWARRWPAFGMPRASS
jgi:hypothetical protein